MLFIHISLNIKTSRSPACRLARLEEPPRRSTTLQPQDAPGYVPSLPGNKVACRDLDAEQARFE